MIKLQRFVSVVLSGLFAILSFPIEAEAETCKDWLAKAVSVQGSVHARVKNQNQWVPVQMNNTYCEGDMIRVQERSRAAFVLNNETIIRLDQHTTITFPPEKKKNTSFIDVITGILHFISRVPRTLTVSTPFVNGSVEGTEFLVRVYHDRSMFTVFEGQVTAANEIGSITLMSGQSAIAEAGKAPSPYVIARPRDAVNWALYYPSVISWDSGDFAFSGKSAWKTLGRKSMDAAAAGNLTEAYAIIEKVPDGEGDASFFTYRASLLLSVGRVDEASADIEQALQLAPGYSNATALQSVIAVVQNDKEKALSLARKALETDPDSAAANIALSYALQAGFDLEGALINVQEAVKLDPQNSLAWARLSELWLSHRELDRALEAARTAVEYNPDLARTQSVLGFAHLAQIKIENAIKSFEGAIKLDQAAPLPRLGLGLAKIRQGRLEEGRREIESAASLDPNNSLVRSYLGKAYYEEKRDKVSEGQYEIAEELDPLDPTPHLYDAIQKQTTNRPVEALHDMQKSIELNDNSAIYRSRMLLDEDLAARSASLARIYNNLGFERLALVEGWKSVNIAPGNYSAHRFIADSYASQPRHEIARVSELLQSQMRQPINITPVQPSLGESDLLILDGAGPGDLSFNEFNPLFNRNKISLQLSGIAGENDSSGDEVVISGVYDNVSISLGQFHYETEGFRKNNDLDEDIYNVFAQVRLSHKTSVQAEFRSSEVEKGDLPLRFGADNFSDSLRQKTRNNTLRLGVYHALTSHSDLIASFTTGKVDDNASVKATEFSVPLPPPPFGPGTVLGRIDLDLITDRDQLYLAEVQHLYRSDRLKVITGLSHYNADRDDITIATTTFQPEAQAFGLVNSSTTTPLRRGERHSNFHIYSLVNYPKSVTWTLGGSADRVQGGPLDLDLDRLNPKLGITWNPLKDTTIRAAVFRVVRKLMITNQTLEPTQVAGFNQFFDDQVGTIAWRYGVGIDQRFSSAFYGGLEVSERDMEVSSILAPSNKVRDSDWREQLHRVYLYWTPQDWLAISSEYQFERFDRDPVDAGIESFVENRTHRIPLGISVFCSMGISSHLKATYIDQDGEFGDAASDLISGGDRFWVFDASIKYRLPKRWGIITIELRNLFDEEFNFQDTDPANPHIYPERLILAKFTVAL
jgi:tetratricopeptide (TPR) repeat protein